MGNVNENDPSDTNRARAMWHIVSDVVEDMQSQSPANIKLNIKKFLLHVAWHEGRSLRTRVQDPRHPGDPPGPGRSFFQFEPIRAKEAVDYARQHENDKHWLSLLATRSGHSSQSLIDASTNLFGVTSWPPNNLIEQLLRENDFFGTYLTRISLAKIPSEIHEGNQAHANYWADNWKRVFDPSGPGSRAVLVPVFVEEANKVDGLAGTVTPLIFDHEMIHEDFQARANIIRQEADRLHRAAVKLREAADILESQGQHRNEITGAS